MLHLKLTEITMGCDSFFLPMPYPLSALFERYGTANKGAIQKTGTELLELNP